MLDVGCGRGDDVVAMARAVGPGGRVVGVDRSAAMIEVARRASAEAGVTGDFVEADAAALPFADGSFDACRIDRTLQHVADPSGAVRELVRVCRSGGRIVAAEPDWDTLAVDAPDLETSRAVARAQSADIPHGTIGRALRRLLLAAGLTDVALGPLPLAFDDFDAAETVYGLGVGLRRAVELGWVEPRRADGWWRSLEDAQARGVFWASMTGTIATARKA